MCNAIMSMIPCGHILYNLTSYTRAAVGIRGPLEGVGLGVYTNLGSMCIKYSLEDLRLSRDPSFKRNSYNNYALCWQPNL